MLPADALSKCRELIPELDLQIEKISSNKLALGRVDISKWREVYLRALSYVTALEDEINELPDVDPFSVMSQMLEDLESLLLSLFIFYDCNMRHQNDN